MIEEVYRYRRQRFTEHETSVVRLATEARWSDARIGRMLGRPAESVRRHRRLHRINKRRGRGIWYAFALVCAPSAWAHDSTEPYAEWYRALNRPDVGGPCCAGSRDCRPVEYKMSPSPTEVDSDYEALVAGSWVRVPKRALISGHYNPTGDGVLCMANPIPTGYIYCFVPDNDL